MPNTINLMELVCANCNERRLEKFGTTRDEVEVEITPVDGLQPAYLCRRCKTAYDHPAQNEKLRLSIAYNLVNSDDEGDKRLTGPYPWDLYLRRAMSPGQRALWRENQARLAAREAEATNE